MKSEAVIYLFLASMIPGFEGRYALLNGPALGISLTSSFLVASIAVAILGTCLPLTFSYIDMFFSKERLGVINKLYMKYILRLRERLKGKKGLTYVGLYLFVAIPLPASGVWTGSAIAYILGLGKKSVIPIVAGGLTSNFITFTLAYLVYKVI